MVDNDNMHYKPGKEERPVARVVVTGQDVLGEREVTYHIERWENGTTTLRVPEKDIHTPIIPTRGRLSELLERHNLDENLQPKK
jgi:hypothetical protein